MESDAVPRVTAKGEVAYPADIVGDAAALANDPGLVLPVRLRHLAEEDPDKELIAEVDGGRVSRAEFLGLVATWAGALRRAGLGVGGVVATMFRPSIDGHAVWLAAVQAGGVEASVNVELRKASLSHVLLDSRPQVIVAEEEFLTALDEVMDGVTWVRTVLVVGDTGERMSMGTARVVRAADLMAGPPLQADLAPTPGDVCGIIYTSGTTGPSKGVRIRWGQLSMTSQSFPPEWLGPAPASFVPWPLYHVTGKSALVSMAAVGGRVVLRRKVSVGRFWEDIRQYRCTFATCGFIKDLLVAQPERRDDAENPLRVAVQGPAVADVDAFQRRFGLRVVVIYGSTEIGYPIILPMVTNANVSATGYVRRGYRARVVDDAGLDVPPGDVGELWIKPDTEAQVAAGYVGIGPTRPPWRDGWFATGDAFTCDERGLYSFVARMGDMIRRRGENISAFEIEAAAVRYPTVVEAAAVGRPAVDQDDEVHLVLVGPDAADIDCLHAWLADQLPRHMVPRYYTVVAELPKTTNGKVQKAVLRQFAKSELLDMRGGARGGETNPARNGASD